MLFDFALYVKAEKGTGFTSFTALLATAALCLYEIMFDEML